MPQFVIKLALICNNEAAPICNNVCLYIFVIQFCCSYNNLCDLRWGYLTHRVTWLFDHVIKWYVRKAFIFTFARATIQGSFLLIYKQKLKSGFSKSTNLWKKIFISRYEMIMFIYKSWSVNSGLMTLFDPSKLTWADSFAFKILVTIISLQEQRF